MALYPVGQQDFKGIIEDGFAYVDKTEFIIKFLEEKGKYYFLGRPRRFGKSLFLSTLEYFFLGEKELFKGLAVESYDWDWKQYPVIHIDLNGANYTASEDALDTKLNQQLLHYETKYGIETVAGDSQFRFENLIKKVNEKYAMPVVVLVDEYEKPILDNIDNQKYKDRNRNTLSAFYSVLKSADKYLKLVFLTGVTKFGKMSIFSALNNIYDISLDDRYSAICGITEEEMLTHFQDGIESIAQEAGLEFEESVRMLKENYDGYHFSRRCPDIYNPYSLFTAFRNREIGAYWSETGTPTLLARLLVRRDYNLQKLDGIKASREMLIDVGYEFEEPISLFYQTGYLTIKDYNPSMRIYTLGFPNREVEVAFFNFITPFYQKTKREAVASYIIDFVEGIQTGNPEKAFKSLQAFSSSINYEMIAPPELERHFQQMMYVFSRLLLPYATTVKTEDRTSDGRMDMVVTTPHYVYIIEIKRDRSPEEALKQIREKGYARQFETDSRKVFLIGVEFSTESRCLESYKIETL